MKLKEMAPCVLAGRRSVFSILLFFVLFVCLISPNYSLRTYDCKTLLHIRAVMDDLSRSGKCCFHPQFMPFMPVEPWLGLECVYRRTRRIRSSRRRKRGRWVGFAVKARAAWMLSLEDCSSESHLFTFSLLGLLDTSFAGCDSATREE